MNVGMRLLQSTTGCFFMFEIKQIIATRSRVSPYTTPIPRTAIVMQGPICTTLDFTLETLRFYKQTLREETLLILSTWDTEDQNTLSLIRSLGVTVITNTRPANAGVSNINLQITTARSGVLMAQKLGAQYILKTRTDIRNYTPHFEDFLHSVIKAFPIGPGTEQRERIVAFSENTYKYRLYDVSDLSNFGRTDDMVKFWDAPYDDRAKLPEIPRTMREWSHAKLAEVYLTTNFLTRIGVKLDWTLKDSWDKYARHFCILDASQIGMFWFKYRYWLKDRSGAQGEDRNDSTLTFNDWMLFYSNSQVTAPDESRLDEEFRKLS